jgi:metal-sulfur cluster biosynthetic enzyme
MFSKFGKEKRLFKNESFRVKYGTIDALKLNAIYINIDSWVEPKELINFDSNIRLTRKNIISKLNQVIDKEIFLENFIVDLDLRSSGMSLNKKSFMSVEITIYPKKIIKFNSDLIKHQVKSLALSTIEVVQKNNFNFYAKK